MTLSVCMIVKNEERHIENAIKSVLPIADEIIVVDTGSVDRTVEITRELVGQVYFYPWNHDFSKARNFSINLATQDWVMWLDADDIVPETSYDAIRKIKISLKNSYYFANVFDKGSADIGLTLMTEFPHARIFPNHKGIVFEGIVHESFVKSAQRKGIAPGNVQNFTIEHHGYSDLVTLQEKRKRNIRLNMQSFGFPANESYYEFEIDEYFFLYTPNALVGWKGLKYIGVIEPFVTGYPDNRKEQHEKLVAAAQILIKEGKPKSVRQIRIDNMMLKLDGIV